MSPDEAFVFGIIAGFALHGLVRALLARDVEAAGQPKEGVK